MYNVLGWGTVVLVALAVVAMLLSQLLALLGLNPFGG